jgi:penicillin-binding protein 1A
VQPGSAFKPLYYSAALSQAVMTPATLLLDSPTVFRNGDGTPYIPLNYKGRWKGRVTVRDALSQSMNVPSLKVLQAVGFDAAMRQSSLLLGRRDPWEIERVFPRKYPLGLGLAAVSPLQMARAYAVFANQGSSAEPAAIRHITDRDGDPVYRMSADHTGGPHSVLSPQEAYLMVNLLEGTVSSGTLRWAVQSAGWKDRPVAGKTGTTQNWADAWTIGFAPQITTAVWFGFDRPGGTLGVSLTVAVLTGTFVPIHMNKDTICIDGS